MTIMWQRKVPPHDTKPEMAMRRILEDLKVSFVSQEPIKTRFREWPFIADFLVLRMLVIEVHGQYWHIKPRRELKDEIKQNCLEADGYRYLAFWDYEILKDSNLVYAETERAILDLPTAKLKLASIP